MSADRRGVGACRQASIDWTDTRPGPIYSLVTPETVKLSLCLSAVTWQHYQCGRHVAAGKLSVFCRWCTIIEIIFFRIMYCC